MRLSEHPAFSHIDIQFVNHIQKVLDTGTCKNGLEAVQKLMVISEEIERKHIQFTPEMQMVILEYFKNRLPKSQKGQFDTIIHMVQQIKHLPPQ